MAPGATWMMHAGWKQGQALPVVPQSELNVRSIDNAGFSTCYLFPGEREVLIALLRSVNAKRIVEFGVNEGMTAKTILLNMPEIVEYLGIDVAPGHVTTLECQRAEVPEVAGRHVLNDPRFRLVIAPAMFAADFCPVDAAFIDGDHSETGVEHDTITSILNVRTHGLIIWHDYHNDDSLGVRRFLHRSHDTGWDIRQVEGTCLAFARNYHGNQTT